MAYSINKSDGSILATVADGQVDQISTDLTLIGKNYSGFGEALNENFVKLLENFASTTTPDHPIRGQIWFDVSELKLKVYNGTGFQPVSSAIISETQPASLAIGDLWFNNIDKQLYFYDGTNTILLGPDYSTSQGLSGLKVVSILDSLNQTRVVVYLYVNGILLGIFSKDSFLTKTAIEGYGDSGSQISPGFNQGSLSGIKFDVTVTNSDSLGTYPASSYVRNDTSNIINGQLILNSDLGLIVGTGSQAQLIVQDGNVVLANIASNKDFTLSVRKGVIQESAIIVDSADRRIDFYSGFTTSTVNVGGNLVIAGDLTVSGDTTTVNTSVLTVEDKNIELAKIDTPTDEYADGGGIILKGASNHTFVWSKVKTAWESTEHIDLDGKEYKIDGVTVLSKTSLGSTITSIPGVTSFGPQTFVQIGPDVSTPIMRLENNVISTVATNTDLQLSPNGTGNIALQGSPKITGMADPTLAQDAATKEYVDRTVQLASLAFAMDISDGITNAGIAAILDQLAPVAEYRNGTTARILCSSLTNSTTTADVEGAKSISRETFLQPSGSAPAVTDIAFTTVSITPPAIQVSPRILKVFEIVSGAWAFQSESFV